MGYVRDEIEEAVGPKWAKRAGIVGGILAVYLAVSAIFSIWPFSSAAGVIGKVTSSDSIIGNYQWFYDQYNAIQAQSANVEAMPDTAPEKQGMRMVLNNAIAEYNSRSKQITRNLWKASDLPYSIPLVGGSR